MSDSRTAKPCAFQKSPEYSKTEHEMTRAQWRCLVDQADHVLRGSRLKYVSPYISETDFELKYDDGTSQSLNEYYKKCDDKVPQEQVLHWIRQLLYVFNFLHQNDILHGEIVPEALRVDSEGNIRVSNFKLYCKYTQSAITIPAHIMDYFPINVAIEYTQASDVYSLGKVFLYLLCQRSPLKLHRYEIHSMPFYWLIRNMTRTDPAERLVLRDLPTHLLDGEEESMRLVEVSEIPPLSTYQVRDLISQVPLADSLDKLSADYEFIRRNGKPHERLYGNMLDMLRKANDKCPLPKFPEQDRAEARKVGTESLKSALLYQKTGLYAYAKYCYCRALLAYHIAGGLRGQIRPWEEEARHYREVRSGKLVCYANLSDLNKRSL